MIQQIKQHRYFLIFGIVVSMLTWGMSWPSAKVLTAYGTPMEIAVIRFVFTFLTVLFIMVAKGVPLVVKRNGYVPLAKASILMAGYSYLFLTGLKKGMPGAGGVLVTTTTPLVTFLIAVMLSGRKLITKEIIGLLIGFVAGLFLLKVWVNFDQLMDSGNLFFLASTIVWAFLSRITSKSSSYGSPLVFTMWMYFACIMILACLVDLRSVLSIVQSGDFVFWSNILFNGIINAGLATTFFFYATSKMGAEKASSFIYIVPFAAALSSFLFLNEIVQWNTIVGGFLGIASVYIINKKRKTTSHQNQ